MSPNNPLPQADHEISLQTAIEMTSLYRTEVNNILAPEYKGTDVLPMSESFNNEAFTKLIAQDGCIGLRIYLGMAADKNVRLIIVGVNNNDEDMVGVAGGLIMEEGHRCPPICTVTPSPLTAL